MAFDDLMTDSEREEQLRNWWRDNWSWLVSGIALGILLLAGWRYWAGLQQENAAEAGGLYRQMLAASGGNDFGTMERLQQQLADDHGSTPYVDQASLLLARMYVETGQYDRAAPLLRSVMEGSDDDELREVARLRLARVLIEQDMPADALALLPAGVQGPFAPLALEIRGDALHATGDIEAARSAYAAALTADSAAGGVSRELLQLKLQDLEPVSGAAAQAGGQAAP